VLCTAFRAKPDRFLNLTVKKIPKQVLSLCEWDHDDYRLQVENLPKAPPEPGQQALFEDEGLTSKLRVITKAGIEFD
jgi:adenine-specific DNA-methyltransferase